MADIACLENCVVDFQGTVFYILKSTRETYTLLSYTSGVAHVPFALFTYPQSGMSLDGRQ